MIYASDGRAGKPGLGHHPGGDPARHPNIHSGGGSVVIMGLIGLCAVVGWRSRTAMGSDLGWQMTKALGLTGLLGVAFPRYIDNWGHAGGAIRRVSLWGSSIAGSSASTAGPRPGEWESSSGLVIAACGLAQVAADRREAPLRRQATLRARAERSGDGISQSPCCPNASGPEGEILVSLPAYSTPSQGYSTEEQPALTFADCVSWPPWRQPECSRKRRGPSSSSEPGLFQHSFAASSMFASASSGRTARRRTSGTVEWNVRSSLPRGIPASLSPCGGGRNNQLLAMTLRLIQRYCL